MKKKPFQNHMGGNMMLAGFEYWQSERDLNWYFHLKAPNGGILVQSGGYLTEYECLEGIDMVRRYADVAVIEQNTTL